MRDRPRKTSSRLRRSAGVALLVIDNAPLKEGAWKRLEAARKRLTKATSDLHRHENEDEPSYRAWMFATCPALISEIRDLLFQCQTKASLMAQVERLAWREGVDPGVIWQRYKGQIPSPEEWENEQDADSEDLLDDDDFDDEEGENEDDHGLDEAVNELLEREGVDPTSPEAELFRDLTRALRPGGLSAEPRNEAKEIYRRLVQHLHPDRGGEWTPQRQRLWHEVQQAWAERDADWLARLEAEYEIATETLSVASALGRLYAAIDEIEAARRDADRKLRGYRKTPAWRFTLRPREKSEVEELVMSLRDEQEQLRYQLERLEATFARWNRPLGQSRARRRVVRGSARRLPREQLEMW